MKRYTESEVRELDEDTLKDYWKSCMNNRMDEFSELCRLEVVFKSYFLQNRLYDTLSGRGLYDTEDYGTFWDSKRPYGNKDIASSIAFSLGWDRDRVLCYHRMPDFVEDEAMKLHYKLLDSVNKDWEYENKMYFIGFEQESNND